MFRTIVVAVALIAMSAPAYAEAPKEKGVFLGVGAGTTGFDDDGGAGFDIDDRGDGKHGYIGYKFMRHFGIEARYTDIGSFSNGFETLELSSISAHLVGYIPFGRSGWELSGQIGYAQVKQEVSDYYSEEDTAGSAGIAIRWHINPAFAIGAQIDAYAWQNDVIGPEYDVSSGTYLFSIQFNF